MKKSLAILLLAPTPYREPLLQRLADSEEYEILVLYCHAKHKSLDWKLAKHPYPAVYLKNYAPRSWQEHMLVEAINPGVLPALSRFRPDALILNGYSFMTAHMAMLWATLTRTPYLLWGDSNILGEEGKSTRLLWVKRVVLGRVIEKAARVLAIGTVNREYWRSYGATPDQMTHAPIVVDNQFFAAGAERYRPDRERLRREAGWPERFLLLYVGRLAVEKRVDILIEAMRILSLRRPDIGLIVIGGGEQQGPLEKLAQGVSRVHFEGFRDQPELPKYYAMADMFVLPSERDAWGLAVNEAMASGLPVIATRKVGAGRDLIVERTSGYVVPENDPRALASAIDGACQSAEQLRAMGERAQQLVAKWNYDTTVAGIHQAVSLCLGANERLARAGEEHGSSDKAGGGITVASQIRARLYERRIAELRTSYAVPLSEVDRLSAQLVLWNAEWRRILASVPYYQQLKRDLNLPEQFASWREFTAGMPVLTRTTVQQNTKAMTSTERAPQSVRITGGSTAEPIHTPAWRSEDDSIRYNAWLGRSWYGVSPSSPLFMLWGHSHLFARGIKGWLNARLRKVFDRVLGYDRFSAYDLQPGALRRAAEELIRFRPEYVIGYSVALDLFARANRDRREALRNLGLKVIVGAAESFPASDSADLLRDLFGCPVSMEYGAVETGVMAHMQPEGGYRVFWRSYLLEGEKDENAPEGLSVRVTSLYPRSFPLVRYDIGDRILGVDPSSDRLIGVDVFDRVLGRCNAYTVLQDGSVVHSEMFTHALKDCPSVRAYQVIQDGFDIRLHYVAGEDLSQEWTSRICSRLAGVHPSLARIEISRVERLEQTVAGKTPMIIRRNVWNANPVCSSSNGAHG
jgi:glycosyltransferase involved in cell wall biosynthesis/phenylacetate-coenzyme A ligase PaaK-like adenylate-forming protein